MSINFNLNEPHKIILANTHFYEKPTEPMYLNRTLRHHDIIYVCKGSWMITEANIDYDLVSDDVLLLSAEEHHCTPLPCEPNTHTICVHVSYEEGDLQKSNTAIQLPVHMNVAGYPQIQEYFREIASIFWENPSHKNMRMSTIFNQMILDLNDISKRHSLPKPTIADEAIRLVCDSPHKRFNATDAAAELSVCTKTLNAAMIERTGMTFAKYQTDQKLKMIASQIIAEPDLKFSVIASLFGFYDEFHLTRTFKQKYGVSLQQYKKDFLIEH